MVTFLSGSFLVVAISPYKSQLSNGIFYVHIIYIHSDVHVAETDAEPCIYVYIYMIYVYIVLYRILCNTLRSNRMRV